MRGGREYVPRDQSTLLLEARFLGGHKSAITTIMIIKHCRYGWGFTCISPFLLDISSGSLSRVKLFSMCAGDQGFFFGAWCVCAFFFGRHFRMKEDGWLACI